MQIYCNLLYNIRFLQKFCTKPSKCYYTQSRIAHCYCQSKVLKICFNTMIWKLIKIMSMIPIIFCFIKIFNLKTSQIMPAITFVCVIYNYFDRPLYTATDCLQTKDFTWVLKIQCHSKHSKLNKKFTETEPRILIVRPCSAHKCRLVKNVKACNNLWLKIHWRHVWPVHSLRLN